MRITAVTAQKHDPERVNLYIDGDFRCGLCIQTAADFGLAPGRELSPRELNDIAAADAYPAALNAALDYASRTNAKSRSEFLARLSDFPEKAAQAAVKRMEELGYIDDAALAAQIVKRGLANGEGPFMLKKRLYEKRISEELIQAALYDISPGQEEGAASALRRFPQKTGEPAARQRARAYAYLARRGFSSELIRQTLELLPAEYYDEAGYYDDI